MQIPTEIPIRKAGVASYSYRDGKLDWAKHVVYAVQRFMKIAMQSLAAPVMTSLLFLMVFVAIGERASFAGDVDLPFLVPGLVMMNSCRMLLLTRHHHLVSKFKAMLWIYWCHLWDQANYYWDWLLLE